MKTLRKYVSALLLASVASFFTPSLDAQQGGPRPDCPENGVYSTVIDANGNIIDEGFCKSNGPVWTSEYGWLCDYDCTILTKG